MAVIIPGRNKRPPQNPYSITLEHVRCLTRLLTEPTNYVQRFTEEVSFLQTGGQRWVRKLQIQIPGNTTSSSSTKWWIIPLGPFARKRFADIIAKDAAGSRLNFVTRDQHGVALTKLAVASYLADLPSFDDVNNPSVSEADYNELYKSFQAQLNKFYTKMGAGESQRVERRLLLDEYKQLLSILEVPEQLDLVDPSGRHEKGQDELLTIFSDDLIEASDSTQYLCWVLAEPETVVNVEATYTTSDPMYKLEEGSLSHLVSTLITGLFGFFWKRHNERRDVWNQWYAQFGLAPIPYVFNTPTHEYTTSHYSVIEPPQRTLVTYLDWERGSSLDTPTEVESSSAATHIFNNREDGANESRKRVTTHAYLRAIPSYHKQILGVAMLNLTLVALLAVGRFPNNLSSPLQDLLAVAPSVLMVYIAQQQRHYYAHTLKRSRGILWMYLLVEIVFLVTVAFSGRVDGLGTPGLSWKATAAAWLLAISSVMVIVWQAPLGNSYEQMVSFLMKRKERGLPWSHRLPWYHHYSGHKLLRHLRLLRRLRDQIFGLKWRDVRTGWQRYEAAVEQYCRIIRGALLLSCVGTLGLLCVFWHPVDPEKPVRPKPHAVLIRASSPEVQVNKS